MKIRLLSCLLVALFVQSCASDSDELVPEVKLWYDTPADAASSDSTDPWVDDKEWLSALPLGNGSLGAMVFGDVIHERIQLSEESMWSGSVQDSDNPDAAQHLDEIRRLLFEGKYREATELTDRTQICKGPGSGFGVGSKVQFGCFQTLGDLWIDFQNQGDTYEDYHRELNLNDALATVSYTQDGKKYLREAFISHPDQVMVVRFSCNQPGSLSFNCRLTRPERFATHAEADHLVMSGALYDGKGGDGLRYTARLKAVNQGGEVAYNDSLLLVKNADEVVLLLSASTDYVMDYPEYKGRDHVGLTLKALNAAAGKSYADLLKVHLDEYRPYYDRVGFQICQEPDTVPTDRLVAMGRDGKVHPHLYELMFQYGRYLLIASSRPGTLPANLQGIWANKTQTPWNGDYHTDVNVEMNYWLSGVLNLSELQMPLFDLIESLYEPGTRTARIQYNKKGWVVHPVTNVWGYTSPGEAASWGMHTGASAWMCQHIGEQYRFTGDKAFLSRMYPVLKGAVEFYLDWLCTDPATGKLVSGPAVSPENTFVAPDGSNSQISMGPTHDQQTIWQLFDDFLMASAELGTKDSFVDSVAVARDRLAGNTIGSDGRLMEWAQEFAEVEPGHRHVSHLFAVHPGAQINFIQTPELAEAAGKSIDYRMSHGGGHTGWSAAWLVNLYARLERGVEAQKSLDNVLRRDLNPNLFTLHPPFQIDANFGTAAGMGEMLLQSHVMEGGKRIIQVLPALPPSWKNGEVRGLKARGGYTVDLKWADGELTEAVVHDYAADKVQVLYGNTELSGKIVGRNKWKYLK